MNLYNSAHKATTKEYRDHYDQTFKKQCSCKQGEVCLERGAWIPCEKCKKREKAARENT